MGLNFEDLGRLVAKDRLSLGSRFNRKEPPYCVITTSSVAKNEFKDGTYKGLYLSGMYDLGELYTYANKNKGPGSRYVLFTFSNEKKDRISVSKYHGPLNPKKYVDGSEYSLDLLNGQQIDYIKAVLNKVNSGNDLDDHLLLCHSNEARCSLYDLNKSCFDPDYFTEQGQVFAGQGSSKIGFSENIHTDLRDGNRTVFSLKELIEMPDAEVFWIDRNQRSNRVYASDKVHNVRPGDIFLKSGHLGKVLYVDENNMKECKEGYVLRLNKSVREYAFLSLITNFSKIVNNVPLNKKLGLSDLKNLVIYLPCVRDWDTEQIIAGVQSGLDIPGYLQLEEKLEAYIEDELGKAILGNVKDVLLKAKLDKLASLFKEYLTEFRKCRSAKAYLASILMMGSAMETVFVDWIFDISEGNITLESMSQNGSNLYSLESKIDYVCNELKEKTKTPEECKEISYNANEVRKKRNYVHPLYYMDRNKVDEETYSNTYVRFFKAISSRITITVTKNEIWQGLQ